jgi:hypothetical protein
MSKGVGTISGAGQTTSPTTQEPGKRAKRVTYSYTPGGGVAGGKYSFNLMMLKYNSPYGSSSSTGVGMEVGVLEFVAAVSEDEEANVADGKGVDVSMSTSKVLWGMNHPSPSIRADAIRLISERFIGIPFGL